MQKFFCGLLFLLACLCFEICYCQTEEVMQPQILLDGYADIPSFPGGDDSLNAFINRHRKWPSGFDGEGSVIVRLTIGKTGLITDAKILRSLCAACDQEALRTIQSMPPWESTA